MSSSRSASVVLGSAAVASLSALFLACGQASASPERGSSNGATPGAAASYSSGYYSSSPKSPGVTKVITPLKAPTVAPSKCYTSSCSISYPSYSAYGYTSTYPISSVNYSTQRPSTNSYTPLPSLSGYPKTSDGFILPKPISTPKSSGPTYNGSKIPVCKTVKVGGTTQTKCS
jgi:hypothetical protein